MASSPSRQRRWWRALRLALTLNLALSGGGTALAARHIVRPGETLSEIADDNGIALDALVLVNDIADPDFLLAGTTLTIPETAAAPLAASGTTTYRVEAGDTLSAIAERYGVGLTNLLATNPVITDPDRLFIGQVLSIPRENAISEILRRTAVRYGVDPTLVQAIAWQESGWQQGAVSPAGAIGVMQLLPETATWVEAEVVGAPLAYATSAQENVVAGVALLAWLQERAASEELLIAYYFQGQGSVARDGIFPATARYISSVQAIRQYIARHGAPPP